MIVCRFKDKALAPSEISSKKVERVRRFIEKYPDALRKLNIEIIKEGKSPRLKGN